MGFVPQIAELQEQDYSNAGGYGFWCNKACAERKDRERSSKTEADSALAGALSQSDQDKWSPLAITGVVAGSMLAIGLLVVMIRKAKK